MGLLSIAALVLAGRCLLNPLFRLLARHGGREVMAAGALAVVLGSALLLEAGGLPAALGAFMAGVLLSQSSYRHELEADVEPFRGLLLGLFFLAVGMSLDLRVVVDGWRLILVSLVAYTALKAAGIYAVARLFRSSHQVAPHRVVLMAQGGEFAFVLYAAALSAGLIDARDNAMLTATIILSMAITPLLVRLHDRLPAPAAAAKGEAPEDLHGSVLLIGFGRFGQMVSQPLLAGGWSVSIIDTDTEMIEVAASLGFRVWFGDGARLDILHAAGAAQARCVLVRIEDREAAVRIAEIVKAEFPLVPVLARAYDRAHALRLARAGVDFQLRETVGSALALSRHALEHLGTIRELADTIMDGVRARDADRFAQQMTGDVMSGRELLLSNLPEAERDRVRAAARPNLNQLET